ncbi:hypothetical protein EB796_018402 [Bugula neritina]|uniref:Uncharacterized protein n=1 Tax=Bugula neritina TaxID=10212 RepID=A0A7J7JAM2_BUGNE|nr:hypothetical protein EB796_018402 [Bugula neritina]
MRIEVTVVLVKAWEADLPPIQTILKLKEALEKAQQQTGDQKICITCKYVCCFLCCSVTVLPCSYGCGFIKLALSQLIKQKVHLHNTKHRNLAVVDTYYQTVTNH